VIGRTGLREYRRAVVPEPRRYLSPDEDSRRWQSLVFRDGDVVISTRSKCGTTWMQMICVSLVLGSPDLPAPLAEISPWLDRTTEPLESVLRGLGAQERRRVIKTHTPLDGVPLHPRVTYIVVARHPLDAAVSLYHQGENIDHDRLGELTGAAPDARPRPVRAPLHAWLATWIGRDTSPQEHLDDLPGVMWHLTDAWARRAAPNVVLVHYDDLIADLEGQMRAVAARLGIGVAEVRWPALVEGARFASMRARAHVLAPDVAGILKDRQAFFRRGRSGAGREALSDTELARYEARAADLAPPDLLAWLHRPRSRAS
jgi:hypothetical protein